jgi:hypothetical protein
MRRPRSSLGALKGTHTRWCHLATVTLVNGAQLGPPIWTSLSFLGRGTNVWLVREYVVGVIQEPLLRGNVMKTAWRSSARTPESDIYMSIDQFPEGLAKFECGGDVKHAGYPITVQNLRSHPVNIVGDINSPTPPTPVLHRLILGTVGCPLWWEYTSNLRSFLITFQRTRP